ncbi:MAG: V-type ATP synthase subunit F [Candidatus Bathyarchaeia archaeon]
MNVAVIGDPVFVSAFEIVGARGFSVEKSEDVRGVLRDVMNSGKFQVIIMPERYTKRTSDMRIELLKTENVTPVFAIVPDLTGSRGERLEELVSLMSLAVGTKLKLR